MMLLNISKTKHRILYLNRHAEGVSSHCFALSFSFPKEDFSFTPGTRSNSLKNIRFLKIEEITRERKSCQVNFLLSLLQFNQKAALSYAFIKCVIAGRLLILPQPWLESSPISKLRRLLKENGKANSNTRV